MKRFAIGLFVGVWTVFSALVVPALAAPRPGAPRPLQSGSTLISGTHARFNNATLSFARGQNDELRWWSATPVRDEKIGGKIADWRLQTMPLQVAAATLDWAEGISPDRQRRTYVLRRSGLDSVYVEPEAAADDRVWNIQRVATSARNPVWQNNQTLIYESTRPDRKGLYRVDVPADGSTPGEPQLLFSRGGEAAVSRDEKTICLAVVDEKTGASQLYLLAADGSGARILAQTEGARRPVFSPDDKAIFFDAPAPISEGAPAGPSTPARERVLWTLPLVASPPVAQLFSTREAKNGDVEIIGTLFSEESGRLQARLEFSPGELEDEEGEDRVWFSCPLQRAPIHNGVLGAWPLPRKREGETQAWTMRLTATADNGPPAVSTLTFMWPPEKNQNQGNPEIPNFFAPRPEDFGIFTEPQTPVVEVPAAPVPVIPVPVVKPPVTKTPTAKTPTPAAPVKVVAPPKVPTLPVPARVVPVAPKTVQPNSPQMEFEESDIEAFDPNEISPFPLPGGSTPDAPPLARRVETPIAPPKPPMAPPVSQPMAQKKPAPRPAPKPTPRKAAPKPAPKNDGGIPSQMKSGATVPVTVMLRNTGSRTWSSSGESPVRLIYRWVNADSNIRQRWAVHWLGEVVAPGDSTQMKFDLIAPPATGRFILTYALVRLNPQIYDGKSYKPPSTKAKDHRWPGEFGAVSFNINVTR